MLTPGPDAPDAPVFRNKTVRSMTVTDTSKTKESAADCSFPAAVVRSQSTPSIGSDPLRKSFATSRPSPGFDSNDLKAKLFAAFLKRTPASSAAGRGRRNSCSSASTPVKKHRKKETVQKSSRASASQIPITHSVSVSVNGVTKSNPPKLLSRGLQSMVKEKASGKHKGNSARRKVLCVNNENYMPSQFDDSLETLVEGTNEFSMYFGGKPLNVQDPSERALSKKPVEYKDEISQKCRPLIPLSSLSVNNNDKESFRVPRRRTHSKAKRSTHGSLSGDSQPERYQSNESAPMDHFMGYSGEHEASFVSNRVETSGSDCSNHQGHSNHVLRSVGFLPCPAVVENEAKNRCSSRCKMTIDSHTGSLICQNEQCVCNAYEIVPSDYLLSNLHDDNYDIQNDQRSVILQHYTQMIQNAGNELTFGQDVNYNIRNNLTPEVQKYLVPLVQSVSDENWRCESCKIKQEALKSCQFLLASVDPDSDPSPLVLHDVANSPGSSCDDNQSVSDLALRTIKFVDEAVKCTDCLKNIKTQAHCYMLSDPSGQMCEDHEEVPAYYYLDDNVHRQQQVYSQSVIESGILTSTDPSANFSADTSEVMVPFSSELTHTRAVETPCMQHTSERPLFNFDVFPAIVPASSGAVRLGSIDGTNMSMLMEFPPDMDPVERDILTTHAPAYNQIMNDCISFYSSNNPPPSSSSSAQ